MNRIERNKAMKRPCLWDVVCGSWMGFAIGLALIAGNAQAQTRSAGSSVSMIGKISSITGSAITVISNSRPAVVKVVGVSASDFRQASVLAGVLRTTKKTNNA
ncbi:MAG TPA: hypothetical protein VLJ79_05415 [Candidatus Binatia bacterium]|nr:hypothetical protein [Candidatus Binatia bacterium]HXV78370.1 hypothetical protein [Candidatus Binatia bacterium]